MDCIKLLFAGDIFPGGVLTFEGGISQEVIDKFSQYDLRIANLEAALCDGGSECKVKMGDPKLGNLLFAPEKSIGILKQLNINAVSLANNHTCDCDYEGLARTIELLDENGIAHFGAGRDEEEARRPAIVKVKGKKICLLGYFPPDWEAPYKPSGSIGGLNQFVVDNVVEDIHRFKKTCDYVFVMPHWGKEHTLYPLLSNVRDLQKILKAGPTGVLGSHSHLPQSSYITDNMVVAMSMGNFIFPDRYIVNPRKTYYPTEEERNATNVPVTYDFPFVDTLTMVKMHKGGRVGLVCGVTLDDNRVSLVKFYTLLDKDNKLVMYKMPTSKKIKMKLIEPLIRDPFVYRVYCKIGNLFFSKIARSTRRIGAFNVSR